jgi:putative ABC transport system permease protein
MMLSSVKQRLAEIGLRRAIGARPRDIAWQFLLESTLPVLAGGVLGLVLGSAGSVIVARRLDLQVSLSYGAIVVGVLLSALVGLLAGALPARRAALAQPADALRQ